MAIVLYRHKTLFLIDGDLHRVRIVLNWDSMWPTDSVDLNKINKWITKLYQEHSTNIYIYVFKPDVCPCNPCILFLTTGQSHQRGSVGCPWKALGCQGQLCTG
jgi:hypothetical protein